MSTRAILKGLATYLPSRPRASEPAGTISARYCYAVWLRHLVMAHRSGLPTNPDVVVELGPGDSLGLGLAALLTGASRYHACDIVQHTDVSRNLRVLDELVRMLRSRVPVPDESEFPEVLPFLGKGAAYRFPHEVLPDERLETTLAEPRVEAIRGALERLGEPVGGILMSYVAHQYDSSALEARSVDMVVSQAVMEHVDDPLGTYTTTATWLKPDGFASHVIDFRSHGTADTWDGHWAYSDAMWKVVRGRRKFVISNRVTLSAHLDMLRRTGFEVLACAPTPYTPGVPRGSLAPRFAGLPDQDLRTGTAFIQVVPRKQ